MSGEHSALPHQPATDEGEASAFDLMQEFYLSRYYDPKAARPADNVQAAIQFILDRPTPTSQPPAAETRLREELKAVLAKAQDAPKGLKLGILWDGVLAALTQPEPTAQQGGEEIMELRDRVQRARDSAGSHFTTLMNQTADQVIAALSAQQAAGEAEAVRELIEMLSPDGPKQDGATVFDHTPEEIGLHVMENHEAIRATLSAPTEPVAFASPGQLAQLADKTEEGGTYIPLRKTSVGNFTMALYATPQPTETQRIVAWQPIEKRLNELFPDWDGDQREAIAMELAFAATGGEHLAGEGQ